MKIVKRILIAVIIIIAIPLIVALFISKEYSVEREVTINKPKEQVFNFVKIQKNQESYNKWVMADPSSRKECRGTDGTVGFVYAWNSKDDHVGEGEQEIKSIKEGEAFETEVRFKRPFENTASTYMTTESVNENTTKLKWGMKGRNPYPMNFMNLFIPNMLGNDLQTSLATLKNVLEKS